MRVGLSIAVLFAPYLRSSQYWSGQRAMSFSLIAGAVLFTMGLGKGWGVEG